MLLTAPCLLLFCLADGGEIVDGVLVGGEKFMSEKSQWRGEAGRAILVWNWLDLDIYELHFGTPRLKVRSLEAFRGCRINFQTLSYPSLMPGYSTDYRLSPPLRVANKREMLELMSTSQLSYFHNIVPISNVARIDPALYVSIHCSRSVIEQTPTKTTSRIVVCKFGPRY